MKRNKNLSLRKTEGLARARAEGLRKGEIATCFNFPATVLQQHDLLDKPHKVYNIDGSGFLLNNCPPPPKTVMLVQRENGRLFFFWLLLREAWMLQFFNPAGTYFRTVVILRGSENSAISRRTASWKNFWNGWFRVYQWRFVRGFVKTFFEI
jgi:hypothetical protein